MEIEDPYEVRLYEMFKSCDKENRGFLDEQGLRQLCSLLELTDKGKVVIEDFVGHSVDSKEAPFGFERFKEALLKFLGDGSESNTETTASQYQSAVDGSMSEGAYQLRQRSLVISEDAVEPSVEGLSETSEREVAPKLIVGTKKYGRRSRPQKYLNDDSSLSDSDENESSTCRVKCKNKTVERSSSQTDISCTRRPRTLEKSEGSIKRCTSLPAQNTQCRKSRSFAKQISNVINTQNSTDNNVQKPLSSSVESLGHEILSTTIRDVWSNFSAEVGSSYLTCSQLRSVCERLGLQTMLSERVAIESFDQLHACQYNQLISVHDFIKLLTGISIDDDQSGNVMHEFCDSDKLAFKVDTSANMEILPKQNVIDILERSGISNGMNILMALGFDDNEVCLANLYKVMEEEVRSLEAEQQTTLLRASLAIQTAELASVRQVLRQVHDDNKQLRSDNKEANRRVTMLAMEIDERHADIEENTKKEVEAMEQRHSNVIRELTSRMASDREHWNNLITKLESRIRSFEEEEIRLKTELELVHKENEELENEQQSLQKQITEVLEENIKLNREIVELSESIECKGNCERRYKDEDIASGNAPNGDEALHLIDKLASLQLENHQLRDKNDELVMEVENLNLELQRYKSENKKRSSTILSTSVQAQSECEAGKEPESDFISKTHIKEENPTKGNIVYLGSQDSQEEECAVDLSRELQQQTKEEVPKVVASLQRRIAELETLLKAQKNAEKTDNISTNNTDEPDKSEYHDIVERCKELETSLQQMQAAYEDCEDYWQSKLSEERKLHEKQRQLFEDEQQESDKKFLELMEKIREYEEQFSKNGRLSPIEEKDVLEQQFVEIEAELKAEREKSEIAVEEKDKEIKCLQKEIDGLHSEIENLHSRLGEIVTDACDFSSKAAAGINVTQRESHESSANSPISYLWHQSTIQQPANLLEHPSTTTETNGTQSTQSKPLNHTNLSTTELSTFSTPLTSISSPPQQPGISPIQKPLPKSSQSDTDGNGAVADCDTISSDSGKSFGTQSLVSTQSEKPRSAQNDNVETRSNGKRCVTPTNVMDEIKRLKFLEHSLQDEIKDLSFQRDGLVMELQQLQEARPVLEKAYTRTAHPNLTQRISQLELKNRHLQNVIKQQQQYSESMMQQSWRQYQTEMNELRSRLDAQVAMITEQGQRLQSADILVKDLYVENAHLSATVQRLEQQRFRVTMMHQQQQQHMNQLKGISIVPGLP